MKTRNPFELLGLLAVLQFVVPALLLVVLFPLDVAAPLLPLLLFFLVVLHLYRS